MKQQLLPTLINQSPAYTIDNANEKIHFVATPGDWVYCDQRLKQAKVVGFDTETKPEFRKGAPRNPCSLLQIAVRDAKLKEEVFVLDLIKLPAKVYNLSLSALFLSKKIVKLGQGFYNDLKELAQSYPKASCFTVAKNVLEVNDLSISLGGAHHPISLQKLVFLYLQRRLTKTQQTSNWNRRPLTFSQLHYAAADALVLIHIYDELMQRIKLQQSGSEFKLDSIMSILDVHVPPTPKCNLCFTGFESDAKLKAHRKECCLTVRKIDVCQACEQTQLLTALGMEDHVSQCAEQLGAIELIPAISTRKRPVSAAATPKKAIGGQQKEEAIVPVAAESNKSKKRKAAAQAPAPAVVDPTTKNSTKRQRNSKPIADTAAPSTIASSSTPSGAALTKSQKKRNRKKRVSVVSVVPLTAFQQKQQRKMSMDSTLMASDDMWSQISTDHSSSMFSP